MRTERTTAISCEPVGTRNNEYWDGGYRHIIAWFKASAVTDEQYAQLVRCDFPEKLIDYIKDKLVKELTINSGQPKKKFEKYKQKVKDGITINKNIITIKHGS